MLWFSQCSSAGADDAVDRGDELGVVEPILRLPLELRLLNEDAEDAGEPLADVLGDERHAFRREVVRLDEVAHRLADAGAQPALVRAAGSGRDAVDVRAHVLVGRLGPLQHEIERRPSSFASVNGASCTGLAPRSATIFFR